MVDVTSTTEIINTSVDFDDRIPLFVTSKQGEFMLDNLNRSELVSRGLWGGAVVVAAFTKPLHIDVSAPLSVANPPPTNCHTRIYSDGWCEQLIETGDAWCPDDASGGIFFSVPFRDAGYFASATPIDTGVRVSSGGDYVPSVQRMSAKACKVMVDLNGGDLVDPSLIMSLVVRGHVTQETLDNVLAGKEWDPINETWI